MTTTPKIKPPKRRGKPPTRQATVDLFPAEPTEDLGEPVVLPVETRWPLNIVKAERTIFELHRLWRRGTLRLAPDFQREFVWSAEKQIKLVESVMARIPLPVFYLSDESEDEMLVVDGQQRLTTLFSFIEGYFAEFRDGKSAIRRKETPDDGSAFALRHLRLLKELEGKTFSSFDAKLQRRFEETPLTCFVIQPGTHTDVKFELFERINEGSAPLLPQEIRNALYQGEGLALVKRLAKRLREVAGEHRSYSHMRADELVLRALAFMWRGAADYKGDLKLFLNETLDRLNKANIDERQVLEARFRSAVSIVERVFGEHAWQRRAEGKWQLHISGPLVEAVTVGLERVFGEELPTPAQRESIQRDFEALCANPAFEQAILTATQTKKNVFIRLDKFEEIARRAHQLHA